MDWHELVKQSEPYYPGIDLWLNRKVLPDLEHGDREIIFLDIEGFLDTDDSKRVGFCIIKHGSLVSKICHLQVIPEYRCAEEHYGDILLKKSLAQIKSPLVVATFPEEVPAHKLLINNGFHIETAKELYRPGMLEYIAIWSVKR